MQGQQALKEDTHSQNVADSIQYNKAPENSSFNLVMSQMNIADQVEFKKQLAEQWNEAAEERLLLSVLICEIDFYNEYVDNYGVQGASFMLISVAVALKTICEQHGCFLARNENQGFTILIKGGNEASVRAISDSLCAAVKESRTEHKYSKISNIVTLSIGISGIYPETRVLLQGMAKSALHNARVSGGNRVSNDSKEVLPPIAEEVETYIPEVKEAEANQDWEKVDIFAESETEEVKEQPRKVKMYRGHAIEIEEENPEVSAPKGNRTAPAMDRAAPVTEKEELKKKQPAPKMYRGHIIHD